MEVPSKRRLWRRSPSNARVAGFQKTVGNRPIIQQQEYSIFSSKSTGDWTTSYTDIHKSLPNVLFKDVQRWLEDKSYIYMIQVWQAPPPPPPM